VSVYQHLSKQVITWHAGIIFTVILSVHVLWQFFLWFCPCQVHFTLTLCQSCHSGFSSL